VRFKAKHDQATVQMLARCIEEVESRTDAEVALVIRRASGVYRDVDFLFGAVAALLILLYKLFSATEFDPLSIPLPLILGFALAARLSLALGRYGPRRYLTTARRRERQVRDAAAAAYHHKGIDRVPSRAGILLYFSALEQRAELVCGDRARAAIESEASGLERLREQLRTACASQKTVHGSIREVAAFLRSLGVLLGRALPCGALGHVNALDNTPDLDDHERETRR
jgi:uncharacterized membrane protein